MNDPFNGNQDPENNNNWEVYNFDLLLPQGSPPGQWGMASAYVKDKAGNWEEYSFVEYVRFDIIASDIELTVHLEVEITDKVVNTYNVDNITASMSCEPCEGLNYVYTIYSLMGGNVVRGEGVFETDSISVSSINTTGVLDGIIKLTIQVTDTEDKLVATKTAEYTKDTVLPNSYYSQSNLENDGTSSLDDFVIAVVVESVDIGGTFELNIDSPNTGRTNNGMSLNFQGDLNTEITSLENLDLSPLEDGDYKFELSVTDPNKNIGDPEVLYYRKEGNSITLIGTALGVTSDLFNTNFYISPNPVASELNIKTTKGLILDKISIYDITGRKIFSSVSKEQQPNISINVEGLSKGVYILRVSSNENSSDLKFIKK
jgi:hypothetical protein